MILSNCVNRIGRLFAKRNQASTTLPAPSAGHCFPLLSYTSTSQRASIRRSTPHQDPALPGDDSVFIYPIIVGYVEQTESQERVFHLERGWNAPSETRPQFQVRNTVALATVAMGGCVLVAVL